MVKFAANQFLIIGNFKDFFSSTILIDFFVIPPERSSDKTAVVEGDVAELKLRIDNNSEFTGMNLIAKTAELVAEGNSITILNVIENATIDQQLNSRGYY